MQFGKLNKNQLLSCRFFARSLSIFQLFPDRGRSYRSACPTNKNEYDFVHGTWINRINSNGKFVEFFEYVDDILKYCTYFDRRMIYFRY